MAVERQVDPAPGSSLADRPPATGRGRSASSAGARRGEPGEDRVARHRRPRLAEPLVEAVEIAAVVVVVGRPAPGLDGRAACRRSPSSCQATRWPTCSASDQSGPPASDGAAPGRCQAASSRPAHVRDHPVPQRGLVGPEVAVRGAQVERAEVRQRRAPEVARDLGAGAVVTRRRRLRVAGAGSADGRLELLAELDGPPERRPDRLGQDGPQPARLELVERGRRRPAGRGDHVAQLGRVHPGLLREERRALERLDDEVVGDVPREAEVDGRVDERLHDEEDVGRAGAADRGRHRDHLLVVDLELGAERAEQGRRLGPLRLGRLGRRVPDGHALAEPGRRVRHAADDLVVAEDRRSAPSSSRRPARSGRAGRAAGAGRSRGRPCRASGA